MKYAELHRLITQNGWVELPKRGKGSHKRYVKDGKVCFASSTENVLRANTAYIYVESDRKDQNPSGCLFLVDEVNGINEVLSDNGSQAPCYDLQGRRVTHPAKGIYIINGKKVVY